MAFVFLCLSCGSVSVQSPCKKLERPSWQKYALWPTGLGCVPLSDTITNKFWGEETGTHRDTATVLFSHFVLLEKSQAGIVMQHLALFFDTWRSLPLPFCTKLLNAQSSLQPKAHKTTSVGVNLGQLGQGHRHHKKSNLFYFPECSFPKKNTAGQLL